MNVSVSCEIMLYDVFLVYVVYVYFLFTTSIKPVKI